MKRITLLAALLGTVMSTGIHASEFGGHYVGLNIGKNRASQTSMPDASNAYLGVKAGYNLDLDGFLLGVEAFADNHTKSYTGRDAGADARFGLPMNRWLPYVKLGMVATNPGFRPHGGLGVEYNLGNRWSVNAEWTTDSKDVAGITRKNNNIAIGLNFRLDARPARSVPPAALASATAADDSAAQMAAAERVAGTERAVSGNKAPAKSVYRIWF